MGLIGSIVVVLVLGLSIWLVNGRYNKLDDDLEGLTLNYQNYWAKTHGDKYRIDDLEKIAYCQKEAFASLLKHLNLEMITEIKDEKLFYRFEEKKADNQQHPDKSEIKSYASRITCSCRNLLDPSSFDIVRDYDGKIVAVCNYCGKPMKMGEAEQQ